jgi:hypothetical protein
MGGSILIREVPKKYSRIPQMGDAEVSEESYLCVNLETGKQIPDVHCAPLGIRKKPLIPISDHGNGRLSYFLESSLTNFFQFSPNG